MRLSDPNNLVEPAVLKRLSKKIDSAMTIMARAVPDGGNPFLYVFSATKEHELALSSGSFPVETAATNGKKFFWNPEWLDNLKPAVVPIVMDHEVGHVICAHVEKFKGKNANAWAVAIDFTNNSRIEEDKIKANEQKRNKTGSTSRPLPTLGSGTLGIPLTIQDVKDILSKKKIHPKDSIVFLDKKALKMTPEAVYEELLPFFEQNDKQELAPLDSHIPCEMNDTELLEEVLVAKERAEVLEPGSLPSYIEEALGELSYPEIDLSEHIRMSCMNAQADGMRNRWKRPRRRSFAVGQYLPTRIGYKPKWLCLLDTSGSMSDKDIAYGISQLQSLGGETDGKVVPVDAEVHWEATTEVESLDDLRRIQIVGRGGTVFNSFFKEFPERLGNDYDVVIIITDGLCGSIPAELDPGVDCIWAITSKEKFKPPFGHVINICHKTV